MNISIMPVEFTLRDFKVKEYRFDINKFKKNLTNDTLFTAFRSFVDIDQDNYIAVMPYFKNSIDIAVYHDFATDLMEYEVNELKEFSIEEIGRVIDNLFSVSKKIRVNIDKRNVAIKAKYIFTVVSENEIYLKDSMFMSEDRDVVVESLDINKKYMIGAGKKEWVYPVFNMYSSKYFYKMTDLIFNYQGMDIMIAPYTKKPIVDLVEEFNIEGDFVEENKMIIEFSKYKFKNTKEDEVEEGQDA